MLSIFFFAKHLQNVGHFFRVYLFWWDFFCWSIVLPSCHTNYLHVLNDITMVMHWRTPHTTAYILKNRLQTVEQKYFISFKCYSPADFRTHHFHAYFHIFKFTFFYLFICISFIFHLFCINYSVLVFGNAIPLFKAKKNVNKKKQQHPYSICTAHSQ